MRQTPPPRPRLSAEQYAAVLATLADRGYLRGFARPRPHVGDPFEFIEFALYFGLPRPYIEPDGYYDLPALIREAA